MAKTDKSVWLHYGYKLFAEQGPSGLKVEILARMVGKSKSSFYHYFSDIEAFVSLLLKMHIQRANEMAAEIEAAHKHTTDFVTVVLNFKDDILFHRQLRFNRHLSDYLNCLTEVHAIIETPSINILASNNGLADHKSVVRLYFQFVLENFLFRVTYPAIDAEWINAFYGEVSQLLRAIRQLPEKA